jgi:hypothetical protein
MLEDLQSYNKDYTFENCKVTAELKPRTWRDIYKFRRNVVVQIEFPKGHDNSNVTALENLLVVHLNSIMWGEEP